MPVHRGNFIDVVTAAWDAVPKCTAVGDSPKEINRNRSAAWVDELAKEIERRYDGKRHRTFWKHNCKNKTQFGLQEFRFDVMVCSVSETKSLQKPPRPLKFIADCHWQIESELSRANTRETLSLI